MSGIYKEIQRYNIFAHILKYDMRQIHRHPMIYYSFINKTTHQLSCDNIKPFFIILRHVMAKQAAAFLEKILKKVEELCASGQYAAALVPLQRAIYLRHLPSRALMANLLLQGREGIVKNEYRAFELVEEGGRLGCYHCQGVMAYCYWSSCGILRNNAQSWELARKSSGNGSRYGQLVLGVLYENGVGGVAQDYSQAVALYRLAAAQNFDLAQNILGCMYEEGSGVAQDHSEALRLYQLAAAQGLPSALYNFASCHQHGIGVRKNEAEAIHWYRRAQAAGVSNAAAVLRRLCA